MQECPDFDPVGPSTSYFPRGGPAGESMTGRSAVRCLAGAIVSFTRQAAAFLASDSAFAPY
jgi:hypothetical protein